MLKGMQVSGLDAQTQNWLKERLGDVVILPVIPLSASEVEDKTVVRGLLDLAGKERKRKGKERKVEAQAGLITGLTLPCRSHCIRGPAQFLAS